MPEFIQIGNNINDNAEHSILIFSSKCNKT